MFGRRRRDSERARRSFRSQRFGGDRGRDAAASINYPLRGAVTWKSTVGTNVASDALANLASSGVKGGALIILGEDYGEGASIMQERTHAFAMKSQMWLLDPRPHPPDDRARRGKGFELSEASNTPVMLMLRIRACHVYGRFRPRPISRPAFSAADALAAPRDYSRIILPPSTYAQEREKIEKRLPAALRFVAERGSTRSCDGTAGDIGIVCRAACTTARCGRSNCSSAPMRSATARSRCTC
jgi:indolepyruvate ferredoxin oxidoreductase alpha subunit